jgi:Microtubule-associated protein 70
LEIKKLNDEKKASVAAQFAAEATVRRVHAAQKDDDMPPIEAILAPLEAELKVARQEVGYQMIFISAASIAPCLLARVEVLDSSLSIFK